MGNLLSAKKGLEMKGASISIVSLPDNAVQSSVTVGDNGSVVETVSAQVEVKAVSETKEVKEVVEIAVVKQVAEVKAETPKQTAVLCGCSSSVSIDAFEAPDNKLTPAVSDAKVVVETVSLSGEASIMVDQTTQLLSLTIETKAIEAKEVEIKAIEAKEVEIKAIETKAVEVEVEVKGDAVAVPEPKYDSPNLSADEVSPLPVSTFSTPNKVEDLSGNVYVSSDSDCDDDAPALSPIQELDSVQTTPSFTKSPQ